MSHGLNSKSKVNYVKFKIKIQNSKVDSPNLKFNPKF